MLGASICFAAPVEDARGFRFDLPTGFEAIAPAATTWQRADQQSPSFAALTLSGLGATIAQAPTDHAIVESNARQAAAPVGITIESFAYRTLRWKGLDLEVLELRSLANGAIIFQLTTQLPFEHEAMQVGMLGMASNEANLRSEFDAFILSFDGPVTWKSADQQRDRRLGELAGSICGLMVVLAFSLAAWLLFRKAKTRPS